MSYNLPLIYEKIPIYERKKVREQYIKEQEGKCFYCQEPLNESPPNSLKKKKINWKLFPPNFLKHPIHLQHDHQTGLTEGAVHALCNAIMWQYEGR